MHYKQRIARVMLQAKEIYSKIGNVYESKSKSEGLFKNTFIIYKYTETKLILLFNVTTHSLLHSTKPAV